MTKKIIAMLLIVVVVFVLGMQQSFAVSISAASKVVYVDGIKFRITVEGENTIIKTEGEAQETKMILDAEGNAVVYTYNELGQEETMHLKINELTKDNISVILTKANGEKTEYNNIEDLQKDEYVGQAAIAIGVGYSITYIAGVILLALLVTAATICVAGITYRALDYALEKARVALNSYYRAYITNNIVWVSVSSISYSTALACIKANQNIYTFYKSNAFKITQEASFRVIGPEIDKKTTSSGILKRGVYYYHYHPSSRGCHIFYGMAYVY